MRRRWPGSRWVRDLFEGIVWGALCSVLWFELAGLLLATLLLVVFPFRIARRRRRGEPTRGMAFVLCGFIVVVAAAALAPFKFVDRAIPVELSSTRMPVDALLKELTRTGEFASRDVTVMHHEEIVLADRRPTYRELDADLRRQAGLELEVGYCGTSVTVLWGAFPIGPVRIVPVDR